MEKNSKRPRLATSEPSSSLSTLLSTLNKLEQQLANNTNYASNEVQDAINEVSRSMAEVEGSAGSTPAQIDQIQRKELEELGGKLWNCSRTMDMTAESVENVAQDLQGRKAVAKGELVLRLFRKDSQLNFPLPSVRHLALSVIKLVTSHTSDIAGASRSLLRFFAAKSHQIFSSRFRNESSPRFDYSNSTRLSRLEQNETSS